MNPWRVLSGASPPNPHPLFKKSGAKIIKKSRKARFLRRFFLRRVARPAHKRERMRGEAGAVFMCNKKQERAHAISCFFNCIFYALGAFFNYETCTGFERMCRHRYMLPVLCSRHYWAGAGAGVGAGTASGAGVACFLLKKTGTVSALAVVTPVTPARRAARFMPDMPRSVRFIS